MSRKIVLSEILIVVFIIILELMLNIIPIKASGIIYIRTDGSVDPPTAPIHRSENIYNFTANINNYLVVEKDSIIIDGAGYILQGTGTGKGIDLSGRHHLTIKNMKINEFDYGIYLVDSSNNQILENMIICMHAIVLWNSSANTINRNNIKTGGIFLIENSSNNIVSGNIVDRAVPRIGTGIALMIFSSYNLITGNIVKDYYNGIGFDYSSANIIYHNSFIDNYRQVDNSQSTNIWDNGYPYGGNYWSNYDDVDLYSGSYQNGTGIDGIWDHPYVINGNNRDNYPLTNPYISPEDVQVLHYFYYDLLDKYSNLQASYTQLRELQELILAELNAARNLMSAFIVTTVIFMTATLLVILFYKRKYSSY